MPLWLTKRNLTLATCCVGAAAILLFPASLLTLGLGVVVGARGEAWLSETLNRRAAP